MERPLPVSSVIIIIIYLYKMKQCINNNNISKRTGQSGTLTCSNTQQVIQNMARIDYKSSRYRHTECKQLVSHAVLCDVLIDVSWPEICHVNPFDHAMP